MGVALGIWVLGYEIHGPEPKPEFYLGLCSGSKPEWLTIVDPCPKFPT